MKPRLFTPGPTQVPEETLLELARPVTYHRSPEAKAVFATLSETSTGVGHDIEAFGKLVAKTDALLVVDGISGLGAMECRVDAWGIDVCVTGSQKALMLPPGLAFVSVSEKAWRKIDATPVRAFYLDLRRYRKSLAESDTPFTPANTLIRAQRASLKRIRAEGIENLWARHAKIAAACRAGVKGMGLEVFAERPNNALTVIAVPSGVDGTAVLKKLEKQHGY